MRPKILDHLFKDDRMFILEISRVTERSGFTLEKPKKKWAVITRRNVPGYPPTRTDTFSTQSEAINYYKKVVVETPRVSLNKKSPEILPSLEDYKAWLVAEKLYDPVLNKNNENT